MRDLTGVPKMEDIVCHFNVFELSCTLFMVLAFVVDEESDTEDSFCKGKAESGYESLKFTGKKFQTFWQYYVTSCFSHCTFTINHILTVNSFGSLLVYFLPSRICSYLCKSLFRQPNVL